MPFTKRNHDIDNWDPEDLAAWNDGGAKIARRNLIWSIIAEHVREIHLGFVATGAPRVGADAAG